MQRLVDGTNAIYEVILWIKYILKISMHAVKLMQKKKNSALLIGHNLLLRLIALLISQQTKDIVRFTFEECMVVTFNMVS